MSQEHKDRILALCKENNMTLTELEKELGIGHSTLTSLERHEPKLKLLTSVAEYFGTSVSYLIGETDGLESQEVKMIARAEKRMTPVDKAKMMALLKISFPEHFSDDI